MSSLQLLFAKLFHLVVHYFNSCKLCSTGTDNISILIKLLQHTQVRANNRFRLYNAFTFKRSSHFILSLTFSVAFPLALAATCTHTDLYSHSTLRCHSVH